jgi:hypothetical protein
MVITIGGLYLIAGGDWRRLLVAFIAFFLVRLYMVFRLGKVSS